MQTITNLSPLDGRYLNKVKPLRDIASEYGLIKYRLQVEIEWLIALSLLPEIEQCPALDSNSQSFLRNILKEFTPTEAEKVKDIEATTNHDVKAVEYYLKQKMQSQAQLATHMEFVHFGCTSEDINNLAYGLMLKDCASLFQAQLADLTASLTKTADTTKTMAMLSLTHGQPASPTTLGKEIANVAARLERQTQQLSNQVILGKINGAVGNFNAHIVAYPSVNWQSVSKSFIEGFGLTWNAMTTQIEPHDGMAEMFDNICRINTILIDFARDVWGYISRGIFTQKLKDGEVGSSTMPHKINPIDFENAEGNLGVANALLGHLARKLPVSRYQRDLTDSTVLRNVGSCFGYTLIAVASLSKGLSKLEPNQTKMQAELNNAWEVLAEPIQTVMRQAGIEKPYEKLKELTRGQAINQETLAEFLKGLDLNEELKQRLLSLSPDSYVGLSQEF